MPDGTALGIGVLASGGGSNFEALARACKEGRIPAAKIQLLVTNKMGVGALDRAVRLGIESLVLDPGDFPDRGAYFDRVAAELEKRGVQLVCLAGFLLKLEASFVARYRGRILNIHPALLPKFGGKGMFGHHVHSAVLAAGEVESGCTVHVVDEEFDHGPVLAQARVPVFSGDTPEMLAARVLIEEHRLYPAAVRDFISQLRKETP
jgi:formyltetrahydrofolate-dependent phosphoribosylglycinamide formyltransferase